MRFASRLTTATLSIAAGLALLSYAHPAKAVTMESSLSAWQAAVGSFTETTNLGVPNGTLVNSATLADGTSLGFAQTLQTASIGAGWATWCCGYTGQVLESYGTGSYHSENWTISPVSGFGMYIEPDPFGTFNITLGLDTGQTLTQSVSGDAGAQFFGWAGTGVTSLTISSTVDFAEGDFFSSKAVPEPASLAIFGTALAGFGLIRRRRRSV